MASLDEPGFMNAMVMRGFGAPEVMQLERVPIPVPGPQDILVRVHSVSVNRTLDLRVRAGDYPRAPALPHVLGVDPAGRVAAVGAEVTDLKVGDPVAISSRILVPGSPRPKMLGMDVWGGYAEYVCVPARNGHLLPDGMDFAAASIALRHMPQAFHMLETKARLQKGEWVLIMGAAGGLGSASVQLARHLGGRVIVAAGADSRVVAAMTVGGEFGINYRTQDLYAEVMRITANQGVNVVCENIGDPELFSAAFKSLGRFGRLVTVGSHGGGTVPLDISHLYINQITIMGSTMIAPDDVQKSLALATSGGFEPLIDRVMPLQDAAQAHAIAASGDLVGKIVLDPQMAVSGAAGGR
ncbi:MAG TPA: zinc-binding dehydrogenase [Arsenicitalea sp.]|nr:zinc-binding dehydrogenase [Arsenicitalea sp.]